MSSSQSKNFTHCKYNSKWSANMMDRVKIDKTEKCTWIGKINLLASRRQILNNSLKPFFKLPLTWLLTFYVNITVHYLSYKFWNWNIYFNNTI